MTHRLPGEFINILEKGSSVQEYWCFPTLRHENIKPDQAFRDKQDFFPHILEGNIFKHDKALLKSNYFLSTHMASD